MTVLGGCPRCGALTVRWREQLSDGDSEPHGFCTSDTCPFEY